jgi:hypothetical protein
VRDVQAFGERLHVRVARGAGESASVRLEAAWRDAGVRVASLRRVPASLEDVFIDRVATTREQSAV